MEQDAQNCPRDKSIVAGLFALTSGAVWAVAPPSLRAAVKSSRLSSAQKALASCSEKRMRILFVCFGRKFLHGTALDDLDLP